MSQLVFQPALDPLHAVFRFLRLLSITIGMRPISTDHVRILDFYLLFPFRIRAIRLIPGHQHFKRLSEKYAHLTPYGEQPDAPLLFERMRPMQMAGLETLASKHYIEDNALLANSFKASDQTVPEEIVARIAALNTQQSDLMEFLQVLACDYDISGPDGLKSRTGLMEYRYDAI